jgi:hypothetical protein
MKNAVTEDEAWAPDDLGSIEADTEASAYATAFWHNRWLELDNRRLVLLKTRGLVEQQLHQLPEWGALEPSERRVLEAESGLDQADEQLTLMAQQQGRCLELLPTAPGQGLVGAAANLLLAQRMLKADEHPVIHGLISRAVRDLAMLNLLRGQAPAT